MGIIKWILGAGAAAVVVECGIAGYFFRRTVLRANATSERTTDMAGTDWEAYIPEIKKKKEKLEGFPKERVEITAADGLKLRGTYLAAGAGDRLVICFHGYTSTGMNDFASLADFYLKEGVSMLIVDERAHGESEGSYIGFGCLDRHDALEWIRYAAGRFGEGIQIVLHGISMGGATVLMTSGLELPKQVKAVISDCAFTSAWEVFASVLRTTYHMPAFPLMQIADVMSRRRAGYGLDECNAAREVRHAGVPILFIHGDGDTFVPCRMCHELYENCASPKEIMIVEGAGHAECYYKNPERYEGMVKKFLKEKGGIEL